MSDQNYIVVDEVVIDDLDLVLVWEHEGLLLTHLGLADGQLLHVEHVDHVVFLGQDEQVVFVDEHVFDARAASDALLLQDRVRDWINLEVVEIDGGARVDLVIAGDEVDLAIGAEHQGLAEFELHPGDVDVVRPGASLW